MSALLVLSDIPPWVLIAAHNSHTVARRGYAAVFFHTTVNCTWPAVQQPSVHIHEPWSSIYCDYASACAYVCAVHVREHASISTCLCMSVHAGVCGLPVSVNLSLLKLKDNLTRGRTWGSCYSQQRLSSPHTGNVSFITVLPYYCLFYFLSCSSVMSYLRDIQICTEEFNLRLWNMPLFMSALFLYSLHTFLFL